MRIKILSMLLFLTLLLASPAGPGAAQAPEEPATEESEAARAAAEQEALEEFVPSEKVPADSAISFPVDI
jgi:hypothetical protein